MANIEIEPTPPLRHCGSRFLKLNVSKGGVLSSTIWLQHSNCVTAGAAFVVCK